MSEKTGKMVKTKCYYTDYVSHMVRFYLSTPSGINLQERDYTSASIANWSAVQMVFHRLGADDLKTVTEVFGCCHYLPKAVDMYATKTGTKSDDVWRVLTRVFAKIARVRGLV